MSFQKLLKNKAVILFAVGVLVTCLFTGVSLVTQKPDKNNTKKESFLSNLQPNKDYTFGKNQLGKINFLSLPSTDKNLKIAEININRAGKEFVGYNFQTSLKNGSFGYNLELPNQYGVVAKLVYSEDGSKTFFEHKNVQYSDGKIIGLNINHFTIWAVIGSEDGSSFFNYESYYPLINEASLVGTGNEWVELYNPSQEDFSLKGWKLAFDLDLVISKNGANQKYQFKDTDVIKSKDFFTVETGKSWLNNKIDTVQLVSATGMVVNQLGYSDLTKTSTSNLKQGGFEIGTLDSSNTIARVQDGVNYLVKRSGSEVTKNKSNNISEDSTFLVSIGDGNYGIESERENSANLPKPVDNKPINFGFSHNLLANKWEQVKFNYATSEMTKTLVNTINPLVTLDSNSGIKWHHFRIIKDGETEDGKDATVGNGFGVGGYVFSMVTNNPEPGIKNLDFSQIEGNKNPSELDISNLENGKYWLIFGAEDNKGQNSAPTKNQDPRIRIMVNNTDPQDTGFIKLKSFDCKNILAIDQNTFNIDGKIYSKNDILELWENPSLLSECSNSYWKDNIYLKYQLASTFDETKESFNYGYIRGVSNDQTYFDKYSIFGVYKLEDKNDQSRVVLTFKMPTSPTILSILPFPKRMLR